MKAIQPEVEGYSADLLETMLRRTAYPSSFFDQPVPVRGVCFAAGPDSAPLARKFATDRLGLAILSVNPEVSTAEAWAHLGRVLSHPQTTASRVGILLPDLDQTPPEVQEHIAQVVLAAEQLLWFPSTNNLRKVIPALQRPLLVYLGLGLNNRMRILLHPDHILQIDKGSLKRALCPSSN